VEDEYSPKSNSDAEIGFAVDLEHVRSARCQPRGRTSSVAIFSFSR
jgi:hypothetical protein